MLRSVPAGAVSSDLRRSNPAAKSVIVKYGNYALHQPGM
jgi:hypothetical protein